MNTNHDVNALVSMATDHADKWGDSCHHALAEEIVRLRAILSDPLIKAAPELKAVLSRIVNEWHQDGTVYHELYEQAIAAISKSEAAA